MKLFCTTISSRHSRTPSIKWRMASKDIFSSTKTWNSSREDSLQTKSLNLGLRSRSRRFSRSVTTLTISDKELNSSTTICTHLFSQLPYPLQTQVYPSSYTLPTSLSVKPSNHMFLQFITHYEPHVQRYDYHTYMANIITNYYDLRCDPNH